MGSEQTNVHRQAHSSIQRSIAIPVAKLTDIALAQLAGSTGMQPASQPVISSSWAGCIFCTGPTLLVPGARPCCSFYSSGARCLDCADSLQGRCHCQTQLFWSPLLVNETDAGDSTTRLGSVAASCMACVTDASSPMALLHPKGYSKHKSKKQPPFHC